MIFASSVLMTLWLFSGEVVHRVVLADQCAFIEATLARQVPVLVKRPGVPDHVRAYAVECACPEDDLAS